LEWKLPREVPCAAVEAEEEAEEEEEEEEEEADQRQQTFAAKATHSATRAP
jgi:hypothetical protein